MGNGQERTVGVFNIAPEVIEGYTLFSPAANTTAYLINDCGEIVNTWESAHRPGNALYLTAQGDLYRAGRLNNLQIHAGGGGGIIERFNWEGDLVWSYTYNSPTHRAHHDFQVLPNGNILILAWELKTAEEALAYGRNPELLSENELWPEEIIEITPKGTNEGDIVWEWHAWDHMIQSHDPNKLNYGIVSDHPEKINTNYIRPGVDGADWQHANSIDYNEELDQIMLSVLFFDEIWVIDHSTTTAEAAGPKGDLLFRWGNPQAYDQGNEEDQQFYGQHNAHWIKKGLPDEGKVLVFNNGSNRPEGLYSSVVKLDIGTGLSYPKTESNRFFPDTFFWEFTYDNPTDFYSRFISGAHQLPNGNIFVTDGAHGTFFEIDSSENEVWRYVSPVTIFGIAEQGLIVTNPAGDGTNFVFRATKYPQDYPAFTGRNMSPSTPIEGNPDINFCLKRNIILPEDTQVQMFPVPAQDELYITNYTGSYELFNLSGQQIRFGLVNPSANKISLIGLRSGMYVVKLKDQKPKKLLIN